MEHKNLIKNIEQLIENELENARRKFSDMNSSHEGYAVILEEFEELQEEINNFQRKLLELWKAVRSNDNGTQAESITSMENLSINLIKESIQLASMSRRYYEDVCQKNIK